MRVAYDIDGTILNVNLKTLEILGPRLDVLSKAIKDYKEGNLIAFITGRPESAKDELIERLEHLGFKKPVLCLQKEVTTEEETIRHKVRCMKSLNITHYVGDLEMDAEASRRAGVHFTKV